MRSQRKKPSNLTKRLNQLIDKLDYDFSNFEIEEFKKRIEEKHQITIQLKPWKFSKMKSGAWVKLGKLNIVYYEPTPLTIHANHSILHEFGHIILGHKPIRTDAAQGEIDTTEFENSVVLFKSTNYTDRQEVEAETFATLIQERIQRLAKRNQPMKSQNQNMNEIALGMSLDE